MQHQILDHQLKIDNGVPQWIDLVIKQAESKFLKLGENFFLFFKTAMETKCHRATIL